MSQLTTLHFISAYIRYMAKYNNTVRSVIYNSTIVNITNVIPGVRTYVIPGVRTDVICTNVIPDIGTNVILGICTKFIPGVRTYVIPGVLTNVIPGIRTNAHTVYSRQVWKTISPGPRRRHGV